MFVSFFSAILRLSGHAIYFLDWLKKCGNEASTSEVSRFAWDLQEGKILRGFTYRRQNFYHVILKRLLDFGFIGKETRYPRRIVYAPIIPPILLKDRLSQVGGAYPTSSLKNGIPSGERLSDR